jgi:hypothetical protein
MKSFTCAVLLCVATMDGAQAQNAVVYACTDDRGAKEYKNTGAIKGCKKVTLPGLSGVPQPERTAAKNFPEIDRDRKRILLDELQAEEKTLAGLKADFNHGEPERRGDERNYAKYQARVAGMQDGIARSERKVEALQRELGKLH